MGPQDTGFAHRSVAVPPADRAAPDLAPLPSAALGFDLGLLHPLLGRPALWGLGTSLPSSDLRALCPGPALRGVSLSLAPHTGPHLPCQPWGAAQRGSEPGGDKSALSRILGSGVSPVWSSLSLQDSLSPSAQSWLGGVPLLGLWSQQEGLLEARASAVGHLHQPPRASLVQPWGCSSSPTPMAPLPGEAAAVPQHPQDQAGLTLPSPCDTASQKPLGDSSRISLASAVCLVATWTHLEPGSWPVPPNRAQSRTL